MSLKKKIMHSKKTTSKKITKTENTFAKSVKILKIGAGFAVVLLLFSLVFLFIKQNLILSRTDINITLGVSDYIGLNKDTDKLHMGTTFPGGKMFATMNISSLEEGYVYLTCSGGNESEILDWIYVSNQRAYSESGETIALNFEGRPSKNAMYGRYETTLHIYIVKKNKLSFIDKWFIEGREVKEFKDIVVPPEGEGGGKILISINSKSNVTSNSTN